MGRAAEAGLSRAPFVPGRLGRAAGRAAPRVCSGALAALTALASLAAAAADAGTGRPPAAAASANACVGERDFTAADGTHLHFVDRCPAAGAPAGSPPLVLIPGWAMPATIWKAQVEHFAAQRRVVAFDPRGQGQSAVGPVDHPPAVRAHDIEALLAAARLEDAVLVGWSLAVQELLVHASLHGQRRVRCYVFVDNSVRDNPPPGRAFRERLRNAPRETMRGFVAGMFRTKRPDRELEEITAQALRMPHEARLAILEYPQPRAYWDAITDRLERPVWYAITPLFARQGEYLRAKRSDTAVTVFERAGHALFVDEPVRFNAALEDFLRRCDAAPPPAR